jgi:hypothetical protein
MLTCTHNHLFSGLHVELGDCRSYHHDMIFLRDLFGVRQEVSNELYCYQNRGRERYHWSKLPALYYNYRIPRRSLASLLQPTELHEICFNQFIQSRQTDRRIERHVTIFCSFLMSSSIYNQFLY